MSQAPPFVQFSKSIGVVTSPPMVFSQLGSDFLGGKGGVEKDKNKRVLKVFKAREGKIKMVLGCDVGLEATESLSKMGLVRNLMHKYIFGVKSLERVDKVGWKKLLGYIMVCQNEGLSWI